MTVKKLFFVLLVLLTLLFLIYTLANAAYTVREYYRVAGKPGTSGVDYLACYFGAGSTAFWGFVFIISGLVTLALGSSIKWKK